MGKSSIQFDKDFVRVENGNIFSVAQNCQSQSECSCARGFLYMSCMQRSVEPGVLDREYYCLEPCEKELMSLDRMGDYSNFPTSGKVEAISRALKSEIPFVFPKAFFMLSVYKTSANSSDPSYYVNMHGQADRSDGDRRFYFEAVLNSESPFRVQKSQYFLYDVSSLETFEWPQFMLFFFLAYSIIFLGYRTVK